jgi:4-diphosphocytidyl-2-C-methyl-D-erythritol kinase
MIRASEVRLPAPAKVNLGLRILGCRDDGYHLLESLFVPIDLADRVEIELHDTPAVELRVEGDVPGVPEDGSNLAIRAAVAFLQAAGIEAGMRLLLEKRIPAAAGLGGGSSDAAAVLRGLARLYPDLVPPQSVRELALGLGADVPFFLDPRPALVTGIGEEIESIPGIPVLSLLLAHPGVALATPEVYRAYDASRASLTPVRPVSTMARVSALRQGGGEALAELLENDLEQAAVRLCPDIGQLREAIEGSGALAVGMSGSGPTVFGIFRDTIAAGRARDRLSLAPPVRTWLVSTKGSR